MDTSDTRKRRCWQKKRWIVVALCWLGFVYLWGERPVTYAVIRGWLPQTSARTADLPMSLAIGPTPLLSQVRESHGGWWIDLGRQHRPEVITYHG